MDHLNRDAENFWSGFDFARDGRKPHATHVPLLGAATDSAHYTQSYEPHSTRDDKHAPHSSSNIDPSSRSLGPRVEDATRIPRDSAIISSVQAEAPKPYTPEASASTWVAPQDHDVDAQDGDEIMEPPQYTDHDYRTLYDGWADVDYNGLVADLPTHPSHASHKTGRRKRNVPNDALPQETDFYQPWGTPSKPPVLQSNDHVHAAPTASRAQAPPQHTNVTPRTKTARNRVPQTAMPMAHDRQGLFSPSITHGRPSDGAHHADPLLYDDVAIEMQDATMPTLTSYPSHAHAPYTSHPHTPYPSHPHTPYPSHPHIPYPSHPHTSSSLSHRPVEPRDTNTHAPSTWQSWAERLPTWAMPWVDSMVRNGGIASAAAIVVIVLFALIIGGAFALIWLVLKRIVPNASNVPHAWMPLTQNPSYSNGQAHVPLLPLYHNPVNNSHETTFAPPSHTIPHYDYSQPTLSPPAPSTTTSVQPTRVQHVSQQPPPWTPDPLPQKYDTQVQSHGGPADLYDDEHAYPPTHGPTTPLPRLEMQQKRAAKPLTVPTQTIHPPVSHDDDDDVDHHEDNMFETSNAMRDALAQRIQNISNLLPPLGK